jgi:precorrin-2 dehydrogenase/sirohydrochlorin ferrochelatase
VLVINTLRDPDLSRSLMEQARKERFLVCSTDQPDLSTASLPALIRRGHVRVAISTSGVAPALASRLRQDLEEALDDQFEAFVEWLADLRTETKQQEHDPERRRDALRQAVDGFKFNGRIQYPAGWTARQAQAGTPHG